jgi:hypothetical protein
VADQRKIEFAVVLPVYGREHQSVGAIKQLMATALYDASWHVISGLADAHTINMMPNHCRKIVATADSLTYWQALALTTQRLDDDVYVVNVASDLLGVNGWLRRAAEYLQVNPNTVFGFNGDGYAQEHACHFAIQMSRIRQYGGWPQWYYHNFGDTEIIQRAISDGIFHKDAWSILFHNHPFIAAAENDDVYNHGQSNFERDMRLFEQRQAAKWTFMPA